MARIRTIKPDFFTSEDIVSLSPMARLLYIALWCEADREGRMVWRPATFKLRYIPGDKVSIEALCNELLARNLVVQYGNGYAFIPTFLEHQHINPREAPSILPAPDACHTRADASNLDVQAANPDMHVQVGREGRERKGKEGVETRSRGSRLPPDWKPSEILMAWAVKERPDLDVTSLLAKFRDYWTAVPGSKGCKLDWDATFRNFVRTEHAGRTAVVPDYSQVIANIKD